MARLRTRYQPEPNPVQPIFLTTDDRLSTRSLASRKASRQSVPLPCHISTDALLRIGRNTAETNKAGYQLSTPFYSDAQRVSSASKAEECHYRPLDLYELLRR